MASSDPEQGHLLTPESEDTSGEPVLVVHHDHEEEMHEIQAGSDDENSPRGDPSSQQSPSKRKKKKAKDSEAEPKEENSETEAEREDNIRKSAFSDEEDMEEHAGTITQIMKPVCVTMIITIVLIKVLATGGGPMVSTALVYNESSSDTTTERFFGSLLNALVFVGFIVLVTFVFVILYKYRCLKVIYVWLFTSCVMLLGAFGGFLGYELINALNFPIDWITSAIVVWNFAVVGLISIFWHAHVRVNQAYLVATSVIMALVFTRLPEWTTWAILAAIAIYDIFAVLLPGGPLRVLVETAQERNEPIPALVYNASVFLAMANEEDEEDDDGEKKRGVKLGLGDFVFYSVLVGRAALFDMLTVFTCFIGIVTGLFFTILLLAFWKKALPALPFSIALGILFFFVSKLFLLPFVITLGASAQEELTADQYRSQETHNRRDIRASDEPSKRLDSSVSPQQLFVLELALAISCFGLTFATLFFGAKTEWAYLPGIISATGFIGAFHYGPNQRYKKALATAHAVATQTSMITGSLNLMLAFAACAYHLTFPEFIGVVVSLPLLLIAYMSYRASFASLLVMLTSLLLLLLMSIHKIYTENHIPGKIWAPLYVFCGVTVFILRDVVKVQNPPLRRALVVVALALFFRASTLCI